MNFCAVICEYNPFHNGHRYQLERARELSGCEGILCIMSGNFTQRGEPAVFHKYERARHAVLGGADAVLELPAAFAVAPAELFARGALHILASIPSVKALAFGCESGDREAFLKTARATLEETRAFRAALKENLKDGTSYIRARNAALLASGADVDEALLNSPNNILGTEYCRAILAEEADIEPIPIPRIGSGYADDVLRPSFSSATALRAAFSDRSRKVKKLLRSNLPAYAMQTAETYAPLPYPTAALCALLAADERDVAACADCSEGLERRILAMVRANPDYEEMLKKTVSKRYTLSRIRRILAQNFLRLRGDDVRGYLTASLYCRTLAVKKTSQAEALSALGQGRFPLIARKSDALALKKEALACFGADIRANDLYNVLSGTRSGSYETLFV